MESVLCGVYTLVASLMITCSISDTPQLVCKHRTRALFMKYSIFKQPNPCLRSYCASAELFRKSNQLQVSMVYRLINHLGSLVEREKNS